MPLEPRTLARPWQSNGEHHDSFRRTRWPRRNHRWSSRCLRLRRDWLRRGFSRLSGSFGSCLFRAFLGSRGWQLRNDPLARCRSECLSHGLLAAATRTAASTATSTAAAAPTRSLVRSSRRRWRTPALPRFCPGRLSRRCCRLVRRLNLPFTRTRLRSRWLGIKIGRLQRRRCRLALLFLRLFLAAL